MTVKEKVNLEKELSFGENKNKNSQQLVEWLVDRISAVCKKHGIEKKNGQSYNVIAVSLNRQNNNYLQNALEPFVFLNYSPCDDSSLADDEIAFDLNNIIE